jgi:hypothetical protein
VVFLCFPDSSLNTVLQDIKTEHIDKSEKQIICRPFPVDEEEFIVWKSKISLESTTRPLF